MMDMAFKSTIVSADLAFVYKQLNVSHSASLFFNCIISYCAVCSHLRIKSLSEETPKG